MPGAAGVALLLIAAGLLVFFYGDRPILGLPPEEFARAASLGAIALLVLGSLFGNMRAGWREGLRSLAVWLALFAALVGAHAYRFDIEEAGRRVLAEIAPEQTVEASGGEVTISRRLDGTFVLPGKANGRAVRFIFDTGANVVVLNAETATALGFAPEALDYSVMVATANGRTMAAPLTLDTVTIGTIEERRVRALVAKPGTLQENLLGLSFLDRLHSYEVRRNRLILRGGRVATGDPVRSRG
jgi:aspartyl protease family protein